MDLSGKKQGNMPIEAYISPEWFEWERENLFENCWQFAGLVEDVAEAGDFKTVQCGRIPLVVVRGEDQRLRCFHNICRHRGTQLLRTAGKAQKVITCPYHDWTYSINGQLINVPEREREFPDVALEKVCLKAGAVETWRGCIFVHPNPAPIPFIEFLGDFEAYLGPHQPKLLVEYEGPGLPYRKEINANWKIVAENYIDGYHLAHLHSETLYMYDHAKLKFGFSGPHFWFVEPLVKEYRDKVEKASPLPIIDHIPEDKIAAYVPLMFPNIGFGETESTWSTFHIIPLAYDKTLVEVRSKTMPVGSWEYVKQAMSSWWHFPRKKGGKYPHREDDPMTSGDFMEEDAFACEQQFKAMHSPSFEVGYTAKHLEESVLGYQKRILEFLDVTV